MITDEQHRRVAKRMYDAADGTVWKGNSFCAMLARMTRAKEATRRAVIYRLADLIDRPTCHDATDNFCEFVCSKCGCSLDISNDFEPTLWVDGKATVPSYCPNCGAEVLDD